MVPPMGAPRTGWEDALGGRVFQIAQWYPQIAVFDDVQGQEVAAFVVLTAEAVPDGGRVVPELRSWVRERVSSYKRPRLYRVVDALPQGPTGKVLKREVEHLA